MANAEMPAYRQTVAHLWPDSEWFRVNPSNCEIKRRRFKRTIEGQKIDVNVVDSPVDELLTNRLAVNIPCEYCGYWG